MLPTPNLPLSADASGAGAALPDQTRFYWTTLLSVSEAAAARIKTYLGVLGGEHCSRVARFIYLFAFKFSLI